MKQERIQNVALEKRLAALQKNLCNDECHNNKAMLSADFNKIPLTCAKFCETIKKFQTRPYNKALTQLRNKMEELQKWMNLLKENEELENESPPP